MDIVAKINDDNSFGGNFYTKDVQQDWNITDVIYDGVFLKPNWNDSEWEECASQEEIEAHNRGLIPQEISRMKFIIQVFITTGIRYEDIVLFIQNLTFDEAQKYVILTRLRSATHFDRYSNDLLTIAQMMGITSEQLDSIFINGNLIE